MPETTRLLAKSPDDNRPNGETLAEHTARCLEAARAILRRLPASTREVLNRDVLLAVALHDVGKAAEGFQRMLRGEAKHWGGHRHEVLSFAIASSLTDRTPVLMAILTHHRCVPSYSGASHGLELPPEEIATRDFQSDAWRSMADELTPNWGALRNELNEIICSLDSSFELDTDRLSVSPPAIDRRWLWRGYGPCAQRSLPEEERRHAALVRGVTIMADHLGSAQLDLRAARLPETLPDVPRLSDFCVCDADGFPRPFQARAGSSTGHVLLRAPTGSGKTEAALLWAGRNQEDGRGLFYTLPTMSSLNAMQWRLSRVYGRDLVGLLHSHAASALYEFRADPTGRTTSRLNAQARARLAADLARELAHPILVATPHQILRFLLRGRGWEIGLVEFPGSSWVFDEIHAYDPRMTGLTLAAARLLASWDGHCLFASATLPGFLEKEIRALFPDIPMIEPDPGEVRDREAHKPRHVVISAPGTIIDDLDRIAGAATTSGPCLVVCNHVATAQTLYAKLESRLPRGAERRLLHSMFTYRDRAAIERDLLDHLPAILVTTQVAEVSLNLDFTVGFSEPAPIDALVQRMGRVNRSGSRPPARFTIYENQHSTHPLYRRDLSSRSLELLLQARQPLQESDLVAIADQVYRDGYVGAARDEFRMGLEHPLLAKFDEGIQVGDYQEWVEEVVDRADGTVEVLPRSLVEEYKCMRKLGLWLEARDLLVPIRVVRLKRLAGIVNTSSEPWVIDANYDPSIGLSLPSDRQPDMSQYII